MKTIDPGGYHRDQCIGDCVAANHGIFRQPPGSAHPSPWDVSRKANKPSSDGQARMDAGLFQPLLQDTHHGDADFGTLTQDALELLLLQA